MISTKFKVSALTALIICGGLGSFYFYNALQLEEPEEPIPIESAQLILEVDPSAPYGDVYALSVDTLRQAGLPLSSWDLQPVLLLRHDDQPLPFEIWDDQLVFYVPPSNSRYSSKQGIRLHLGQAGISDAPPARFANSAGFENRSTEPISDRVERIVSIEENNTYISQARRPDMDETWFWKKIQVQEALEVALTLPHVGDGSGYLSGHVLGITYDHSQTPDHDFDLILNGQQLQTIAWDGPTHHLFDVALDNGSLSGGDNTLVFDNRPEGATFLDISALNALEVRYDSLPQPDQDGKLLFKSGGGKYALNRFPQPPLVLDVTDPLNPAKLTLEKTIKQKLTVAAPSDRVILAATPIAIDPSQLRQSNANDQLRNPEGAVDFIVLTAATLAPALAPLEAAREAEGLATEIIAVESVYDTFGNGIPSPYAIQAFLQHAKTQWPQPAPNYLLIVGDATYDFSNHLDQDQSNTIPSFMIEVTHSGETLSDTRLADTDADGYADFALGRWPVSSRSEVESLVSRTLAYQEQTPAQSAFFASDLSSPEFPNASERLISSGGVGDRPLFRNYGADPAMFKTDTEGHWLISYIGHGSIDLWGIEALVDRESVEVFRSPEHLAPPIVLQFTCLTGYFGHPMERSLSEEMLLIENGPVMIVSATSLTYSSSQEPFATALLSELTRTRSIGEPLRIGDAIQVAKETLNLEFQSLKEVNDTFNLFGDPTIQVVLPPN